MPPKRKIRTNAPRGNGIHANGYQNWDNNDDERHVGSFALEDSPSSDFEVVLTGKKQRTNSDRAKPTRVLKQENCAEIELHNPIDTEPEGATDFDSGLGQLLSLNNILYNNVLKEMLDRLKSIQKTQKAMEEWQKDRDAKIFARLDKIDNELEALQNGTLAIGAASTDSGQWPTKVIPLNPFTLVSELEALEKSLQDDEILKRMVRRKVLISFRFYKTFYFVHQVKEFENLNASDYEKYIRMCWRKIFVDELAEKYCWRGTTTKKCIRPLSITLAIRSASRKKYRDFDESVFDRASQKFFQYAHDRLMKLANYVTKAKKVNRDDPLAIPTSDNS
ncbi:GL22768 [Drosophila persimilis]|uniref:GL22768 n=1 Tax=Drosophila persimilis TaxID=7234 RepID=B4GZN0_DROPE|nr:GL22768 [Drosophila persimilis]